MITPHEHNRDSVERNFHFPGASLPDLLQIALLTLFVGLLWGLVQLMEDIDWGRGFEKGVLILSVGLGCTSLLLAPHCRSVGSQGNYPTVLWLCRAVIFLISLVVCYFTVLSASFSTRLEVMVFVIIILGLTALHRVYGDVRLSEGFIRNAIRVCLACAVLFQFLQFLRYLETPHLIDIGRTTLDAVQSLLAGKNPYAEPIDAHSEFEQSGYKYLPIMVLTYVPLGALMGPTGIRLTNLILMLVVAIEIYLLVRRAAPEILAKIAATLFLSMPILPRMLYAQGVTDLAPVAFLLGGFLFLGKRPGLSGLLMGLSVSAKLIPGALGGICAMPKDRRIGYIVGGLLGLAPAVGFLLWSPHDFVQNIFVFIATRPIDDTSWLYGAPSELVMGARTLFGSAVLCAGVAVLLRPPGFAPRLLMYALLVIAAVLSGPAAHNNYVIWWLPVVCCALVTEVFSCFSIFRRDGNSVDWVSSQRLGKGNTPQKPERQD